MLASHDGHLVTLRLPGSDEASFWKELATLFPGEEPHAAIEPVLARAATQVQEFMGGVRTDFDVPVELHGTEFQKRVWQSLMAIPYGETRSYADIAAAIGKPAAARAVGGANRANRLPLIIPCHRVIASDGGLGGYMGAWNPEDGLKPRLLDMERAGRAMAVEA